MGHWNSDGSWTSNSGKTLRPTDPVGPTLGEGSAEYDEFNADFAAKNHPGSAMPPKFQGDPFKPNYYVGPDALTKEAYEGLGLVSKQIPNNAPGASLDASQPDAQRASMQELLASLQQQAATGNGSWENSLKAATQKTQAAASALGQTQTNAGGDYQSGLMNIGNAQSSAAQRAVGEGSILRTESKNDAQSQLAQLLASQGASDVDQAATSAAVQQERRQAQSTLDQQANQNDSNTESGLGQAAMKLGMGASKGGRVPGQPEVFGDDERNDTVPAMLSPGEIVLPRTVAQNPQAAADFVRSLNAAHGVRHMAGGGQAWQPGDPDPTATTGPTLTAPNGYAQSPSIANGAVLDTSNYQQTRGQYDALMPMVSARAGGSGSVADAVNQQQQDEGIARAMRAQGGRGSAADVLQDFAATGAKQAGEAGAKRGREQGAGQRAEGSMLEARRGQEMTLAKAQQQAAWENTLMNLGLGTQQQAMLRNLFSGAAQGAAALAGAAGKDDSPSAYASDAAGDRGGPSDLSGGQSLASLDGSGPNMGSPTTSAGPEMAFGGAVGGYAGGGEVEGRYPPMPKPKNRSGGKVSVSMGDVSMQPSESHEQRKAREYEEETGGPYHPHEKQAAREPSTSERISDFAQSLSASLHFADGGSVPGDAGYAGYDPNFLPPRRDSGPAYIAPSDAGVPETTFPMGTTAPGQGAALPDERPLADRLFSPDVASAFRAPPGYNPVLGPGLSAPAVVARHESDEEKKRSELGIIPRDEQKPAAEQPTPTAAPAKSGGGGGIALPKPDTLDRGFQENEAQLANQQMSDAAVAQANAEVAGIAAKETATQAAQLRMKEAQDRARQRTDEAMTRWTAAQEEFNRIDTNVDTGRYWHNQNMGQKILGILGLALGAVGTGPDGVNKVAVMMNQAIDRDLEAQKFEHELKLKKGQQRLEGAKTYYAMARESGLDDIAATEAAKSAALESVALKADKMVASTKPQLAKATYQQLAASLHGAAIDKHEAAKQRTFENQVQLGTLAVQAEAAGRKGGLTPERQKSVDDVETSTRNIRDNIAKAKAIIAKSGTFELAGTDQTELERALSLIATDSARLKDPGSTVREGELEAAKKEIGLKGGEIFTRNATAKKLLDSFEQTVEQRRKNALQVRGIQP